MYNFVDDSCLAFQMHWSEYFTEQGLYKKLVCVFPQIDPQEGCNLSKFPAFFYETLQFEICI